MATEVSEKCLVLFTCKSQTWVSW